MDILRSFVGGKSDFLTKGNLAKWDGEDVLHFLRALVCVQGPG